MKLTNFVFAVREKFETIQDWLRSLIPSNKTSLCRVSIYEAKPCANQRRIVVKKVALFVLSLVFLSSSVSFAAAEKRWASFKNSDARSGVVDDRDVSSSPSVLWKYQLEGKTNGFVDWGPVVDKGVVS